MRRTKEDDLDVGDWIAVSGEKWVRRAAPFNGQPFKVVAISLPFIVIFEPGKNRHARLDLGWYKVVKVSQEYVDANATVAADNSFSDEEVQLGGLPVPPEEPPTSDDNSNQGVQKT